MNACVHERRSFRTLHLVRICVKFRTQSVIISDNLQVFQWLSLGTLPIQAHGRVWQRCL